MTKDDCLYPECLVKTKYGSACEHSCKYEEEMKEDRHRHESDIWAEFNRER